MDLRDNINYQGILSYIHLLRFLLVPRVKGSNLSLYAGSN